MAHENYCAHTSATHRKCAIGCEFAGDPRLPEQPRKEAATNDDDDWFGWHEPLIGGMPADFRGHSGCGAAAFVGQAFFRLPSRAELDPRDAQRASNATS